MDAEQEEWDGLGDGVLVRDAASARVGSNQGSSSSVASIVDVEGRRQMAVTNPPL